MTHRPPDYVIRTDYLEPLILPRKAKRDDIFKRLPHKFLIFLATTMPLIGMTQQSKVPQPFHEPSSSETTVSDLSWQLPETMPKSVTQSKVVKHWVKDMFAPPAWFAEIDIDHDLKTKEILIASQYGGSGGRNFLLIQQTKDGTWNKLLAMHGAPIFTGMQSGKYDDVQVYYRNGDTWLNRYVFIKNKYYLKNETFIPRVIEEKIHETIVKLNLF